MKLPVMAMSVPAPLWVVQLPPELATRPPSAYVNGSVISEPAVAVANDAAISPSVRIEIAVFLMVPTPRWMGGAREPPCARVGQLGDGRSPGACPRVTRAATQNVGETNRVAGRRGRRTPAQSVSSALRTLIAGKDA